MMERREVTARAAWNSKVPGGRGLTPPVVLCTDCTLSSSGSSSSRGVICCHSSRCMCAPLKHRLLFS